MQKAVSPDPPAARPSGRGALDLPDSRRIGTFATNPPERESAPSGLRRPRSRPCSARRSTAGAPRRRRSRRWPDRSHSVSAQRRPLARRPAMGATRGCAHRRRCNSRPAPPTSTLVLALRRGLRPGRQLGSRGVALPVVVSSPALDLPRLTQPAAVVAAGANSTKGADRGVGLPVLGPSPALDLPIRAQPATVVTAGTNGGKRACRNSELSAAEPSPACDHP